MTANSHSDINRLHIKVTPNASRNEITGFIDGVLQLKIAGPPVKGKANKELAIFLSQILGVSRSSLSIIKGQSSRNKVIAIEGLNREQITKLLSR